MPSGSGGPSLATVSTRGVALARDAARRSRRRCANSTALATQLVEHLRDQVRRAVDDDRAARARRSAIARVRIREPVAVDAAARPPARGRSARARRRTGSARAAWPRSSASGSASRRARPSCARVDVHARVVGQRRRLQVVERRAHHGDRRAQLVRQPARHLLLVARVLGEAREHAARSCATGRRSRRPRRELASAPRTRPCASIARSASSRRRRMRDGQPRRVQRSAPASRRAARRARC